MKIRLTHPLRPNPSMPNVQYSHAKIVSVGIDVNSLVRIWLAYGTEEGGSWKSAESIPRIVLAIPMSDIQTHFSVPLLDDENILSGFWRVLYFYAQQAKPELAGRVE